jgi:quercetin dioxygenase-like cupin family protein
VVRPDGETEIVPGNFIYVPPDEEHSFVNAGEHPFEFLCVIPAAKLCIR